MANIDPILGRIQQAAYAQAQAGNSVSVPASPADLARQCLGDRWLLPPHLELLNRELVDAAAGKLRQEGYVGLLISLPPRHGKSTLCNEWFPAWYIGTHPSETVISTSYEADFAASWGRRTRDILMEHGSGLFGVSSRDDISAASHWEIAGQGGGMMTAGVSGPLTGKGGRVLILDDFCKNAEEAASLIMREKWWEWYLSTFRTRLEPGGFIIIIATRWHDDDLIGRIIRRMESDPAADRFKVIRLPAIAEENDLLGRKPGEPLWPQRYDSADLDKLRRTVGPCVWSALYQQAPRDSQSAMFRRERFRFVETPLPCVKKVRFWDLAATKAKQGTDPDWTVGAKLGIDESNRVIIEDIRRLRGTPEQVKHLVLLTAMQDGPSTVIRIEEEPGSAGATVVNFYSDLLRGYDVRGVPANSNKVVRAKPLSEFTESGTLVLLRASWNAALLDELEAFPDGLHDDQVDACSGAFTELSVVAGTTPTVETDADKLLVKVLNYEMALKQFRVWNLSGSMLCCVSFQVYPDAYGDGVQVQVLLEAHSETESAGDFVDRMLVTNRERFPAANPHDLLIIPKMSSASDTSETGRELWSRKVQARHVQWDPQRLNKVFGEHLKAGRISVDRSCPAIVDAVRSGSGRNLGSSSAVDSYWEPLARTLTGGIASVFKITPTRNPSARVYRPRL